MPDHAILIGIGNYPALGDDDSPARLDGPVNDVRAIEAWLRAPQGGAFTDQDVIHVILSDSAAEMAGKAKPTVDELEQVLVEIANLAEANRAAGKDMRVGDRLYLFMAGHGFSPERNSGCLFTANATRRFNAHIHATGWLNWLQDGAYFHEFVLWMDCCMDRMASGPVRDPLMNVIDARIPPRASFIAFAAQRPLKAVEHAIDADGGKVHGVFTWALLQGLRGAAADQNGRVTGRSLADWLRNAQSALMTDEQRNNSEVALDPEIIQEDSGLIFCRGIAPLRYRVTLDFPPEAQGHAASLWSGIPPAARQFSAGTQELLLTPGLYLVQVPGLELSQGFEVLGDMLVQVRETGLPADPAAAGKIFTLDIDPGNLSTEIFVIDQRLSLVDRDGGRLSAPLPFGLFKIKTRLGRGTSQRVILLDRDTAIGDTASITRPPSSVVPLPGTTSSVDAHTECRVDAINASSRQAGGADAGGAALMLMVRAYSAPATSLRHSEPWRGVSIVDAQGATVLDGEHDTQKHHARDPYAIASRQLEPGNYFLRQQLSDGVVIEQSLLVRRGWRLEVYLLRRGMPGKDVLSARPRVSLLMRRMEQGASLEPAEDNLAESLRLALADERRILNADLENLLTLPLDNPIVGLTGGHLLLLERQRDQHRDIGNLDIIVAHLKPQLGTSHPDWVALALQCKADLVPPDIVLDGPPMFARSWPMLVRAAHEGRIDLPAVMWERVQALSSLPPFMAWSIDDDVRLAARDALRQALAGPPSAAPAMAMSMVPGNATGPHAGSLLARAQKWQVPPSALPSLAAAPP